MPKLRDICHVRSKNAGPFWITLDLFFHDDADFQRYAASPAIGPDAIGRLFGVQPSLVQSYLVPTLRVAKLSYPRLLPQGGVLERDMHGGQQFVRMLDLEV